MPKTYVKYFKCGQCKLWMTRECPQERNVNGWNRGPSCEGVTCSKFVLSEDYTDKKEEQ